MWKLLLEFACLLFAVCYLPICMYIQIRSVWTFLNISPEEFEKSPWYVKTVNVGICCIPIGICCILAALGVHTP